ncbi:MAG: fibronectin type III domain-containing protein [Patescibacteria group bacterium]
MEISNVKVAAISSTSAEISWETNHKATSKVNYDLFREYDQELQNSEKVKIHKVTLQNLQPDTTYHYEVMSQNGGYTYDADRVFKTPLLEIREE